MWGLRAWRARKSVVKWLIGLYSDRRTEKNMAPGTGKWKNYTYLALQQIALKFQLQIRNFRISTIKSSVKLSANDFDNDEQSEIAIC